MQIATSRAEELERARPFGVVADALGCARSAADPRRAAVAGLLAAQGGADQKPITVTSDPGLRLRAVDAFTDLAEALALAGPLTDDDPGVLLAAAQTYAGGQRPLALAQAAEDAGAVLARHGDAGQAHPLLEQAADIYERLDAARDLARAEAVLREAGIRRGRRGARKRPRAGWQSLTPTERAVVDLVADGLSNPQIGERLYISRLTVQTHIAHVFAKLDLSARAQLAAEVTRHRDDQQGGG